MENRNRKSPLEELLGYITKMYAYCEVWNTWIGVLIRALKIMIKRQNI
jgi:hypothetical protein